MHTKPHIKKWKLNYASRLDSLKERRTKLATQHTSAQHKWPDRPPTLCSSKGKLGCSCGSAVKNPISLQCRRCGFNSWVRKTPWRRKLQPTSWKISLAEKPSGLQSTGSQKSQTWLANKQQQKESKLALTNQQMSSINSLFLLTLAYKTPSPCTTLWNSLVLIFSRLDPSWLTK